MPAPTSISPPLSLDFSEISHLTEEQVIAWLHRRLHGLDSLAPRDPRLDESWHSLFRDLYLEQAGEFRRALRAAVRGALADAIKSTPEQWREPSAVVELLMLVPEVANEDDPEGLSVVAQLLVTGIPRLPWRAPGPNQSQLRLRLHGLIALVELAWHRIPANLHPPDSFWISLWEPAVTDPADPVYGYAGEQAALIFEALEKTQHVGNPSGSNRYHRLEAAFRWLGSARPWRERYLLSAFESLLPSLLDRYRAQQILALLQNETLPNIADKKRQPEFTRIFSAVTLQNSTGVKLPEALARVVASVLSVPICSPPFNGVIEVPYTGVDLEFVLWIEKAVKDIPKDKYYLNSPLCGLMDMITKYIRDKFTEPGLDPRPGSPPHRLSSRFHRFCEKKRELMEEQRANANAYPSGARIE